MKLAYLQQVYERPGPFATAYLDTSVEAEDAAKAIELRWRCTRERLAEQGADEATLDALSRHVSEHEWRIGQHGQVLVGQQGEVVLSDELPRPPRDMTEQEQAHVGPVPHLMPYLRLRGPRIPRVVAVVDQAGARVRIVHATREAECLSVEGRSGEGGGSTGTGTGDQAKENAALVAEEVGKHAANIGAKAIVLAGEPQQRGLVHERIGENVRDKVVETEAGHGDRESSDESLRRQVAETVESIVRSRIDERVQEFEQQRGERECAVEGWSQVLEALRNEQVQTLLWADEPTHSDVDHLRVGPNPREIARRDEELGVAPIGGSPASAAVIRALVGTSAELILVDPEKVRLADGVGGTLRYTTGSA